MEPIITIIIVGGGAIISGIISGSIAKYQTMENKKHIEEIQKQCYMNHSGKAVKC